MTDVERDRDSGDDAEGSEHSLNDRTRFACLNDRTRFACLPPALYTHVGC